MYRVEDPGCVRSQQGLCEGVEGYCGCLCKELLPKARVQAGTQQASQPRGCLGLGVLSGALCGVHRDGGLQGFGLVTSMCLEGDKAGRGEVTRSPSQQGGGLGNTDMLCPGPLAW